MAKERYLIDEYDTHRILEAVDSLDLVRYEICDDEDGRPTELRQKLLKLHQLGFEVFREGQNSQKEAMFDLADELSLKVPGLIVALEQIQDALMDLLEFQDDPDDE
jgi:hypothetical protein